MLHSDLANVLQEAGLLKEICSPKGEAVIPEEPVKISGIEHDSRKVGRGFVFVAIEGFNTDGHEYLGQAAERGARSVVISKRVSLPAGVHAFLVDNTRAALAVLAAHFYGYPAREMVMVGVTGTNGKTTTTHLIESIFRGAGKRTGLIGTIHNKIGERVLEVSHTTPESLDLQRLLREMSNEGADSAIMEVSSHALALERVYGCDFDVAVFTNLTQDHLDFHGSMQDYLATKTKLFLRAKKAVINADDPASRVLQEKAGGTVFTYGINCPAFFRATDLKVGPQGVTFSVSWQENTVIVSLKLTGLFNVYNALAAFSVGIVQGFDYREVVRALEGVRRVPGRFEPVDRGQDFTVIVDYAHTPDGLKNVLQTARQITGNRLITVFGCGGDRDRTKRPLMGEIAARCSDFSVLTSDNPRTEDPGRIIADVVAGMEGIEGASYAVEPDRKAAIYLAIGRAAKGDVIVVAGKGHEAYQIVGNQRYPFDDHAIVVGALDELAGKRGSPTDV